MFVDQHSNFPALAAWAYPSHSDPPPLNRAPLLELIRHLRNGVAHGNSFEIKDAGRLLKFPAHNRAAVTKRDVFEITKRIDGKNVLFDFIEAADVLDVLMSIEFYLTFIRERHAAKELDSLLAP
jgi:hypothetical protein